MLLVAVVALQSGCTGPPRLSAPDPAALGRVAVAADANPPQLVFSGFARDKADGAVKGAGSTFGSCMRSALGTSCSGGGWACGAAALILLAVCGVAGVVGGIAGAATASDAETAQAAVSSLGDAVRLDTLQDRLREQIVAQAQERGSPLASISTPQASAPASDAWLGPLAGRGIDAVLIVGLTRVGTAGNGVGGPLALRIDADARVVSTAHSQLLFSAEYRYLNGQRSLDEWSADDGAPFSASLTAGYESIAAQIHDDVFLLYPFPDRAPQSEGFAPSIFGLAPLEPALGATSSTMVESLRPELRWQAFPRAGDREAAPEEMQRATQVRYDLVIARARSDVPVDIVYRRNALPDSAHRLETPLAPGERYLWSIRARFLLDGRERVTEWSERMNFEKVRESAPSRWSYVFRTPSAQGPVAE